MRFLTKLVGYKESRYMKETSNNLVYIEAKTITCAGEHSSSDHRRMKIF
jgi:hypothetical protein